MNDIRTIQSFFDMFSGIISAISFIASLIVIKVFYLKNLQKNVTNQFVMQLILSEMINNINHVSPVINNFIGRKEEKYYERRRVCFSQMYASLFSKFLHFIFIFSYFISNLRSSCKKLNDIPKCKKCKNS